MSTDIKPGQVWAWDASYDSREAQLAVLGVSDTYVEYRYVGQPDWPDKHDRLEWFTTRAHLVKDATPAHGDQTQLATALLPLADAPDIENVPAAESMHTLMGAVAEIHHGVRQIVESLSPEATAERARVIAPLAMELARQLEEPVSAEVKRPDVWSKDLGIEVLDPDGWRADGQPWGLAITEEDFRRRAAMSTMREVATPAPSLLDQDGDDDGREAAPLDPKSVHVGDTVTVRFKETGDEITTKAYQPDDITASGEYVYLLGWPLHRANGTFGLAFKHFEILAIEPAPEPEPEWKPQMVAVATVRGVEGVLVVRTDNPHFPWASGATVKANWLHATSSVTDVRPLVVIDPERARALVHDHFNDDRSRALLDALLDGAS